MANKLTMLTRREDFVRISRHGDKVITAGLVLEYLTREPIDDIPFRIGYTASKKVGNAVERNLAKRRMRALAAKIMPSLAKNDCDYVLIARKALLTRDFFSLEKDLKFALHSLREQ